MGEIIKVEVDKVVVGLDDGSVVRVDLNDVDFVPKVGDKIKLFKDENSYYIRKIKEGSSDDSFAFVAEKEYYDEKEKYEEQYEVKDNSRITNIYINTENRIIPSGKHPVNKWIYALLALFLGGFGAHKFYSHKIGRGILYLVFAWTLIPPIIAFLEFIIALTKSPDENGLIYM